MDFWISYQGIAFIFCFVLKVSAKESKFVFFFFFLNFRNGISVSKFPSSEAIRKWQTDFSPGEANVCFCCPGKPCREKKSFWFYLVKEKEQLYI